MHFLRREPVLTFSIHWFLPVFRQGPNTIYLFLCPSQNRGTAFFFTERHLELAQFGVETILGWGILSFLFGAKKNPSNVGIPKTHTDTVRNNLKSSIQYTSLKLSQQFFRLKIDVKGKQSSLFGPIFRGGLTCKVSFRECKMVCVRGF